MNNTNRESMCLLILGVVQDLESHCVEHRLYKTRDSLQICISSLLHDLQEINEERRCEILRFESR